MACVPKPPRRSRPGSACRVGSGVEVEVCRCCMSLGLGGSAPSRREMGGLGSAMRVLAGTRAKGRIASSNASTCRVVVSSQGLQFVCKEWPCCASATFPVPNGALTIPQPSRTTLVRSFDWRKVEKWKGEKKTTNLLTRPVDEPIGRKIWAQKRQVTPARAVGGVEAWRGPLPGRGWPTKAPTFWNHGLWFVGTF